MRNESSSKLFADRRDQSWLCPNQLAASMINGRWNGNERPCDASIGLKAESREWTAVRGRRRWWLTKGSVCCVVLLKRSFGLTIEKRFESNPEKRFQCSGSSEIDGAVVIVRKRFTGSRIDCRSVVIGFEKGWNGVECRSKWMLVEWWNDDACRLTLIEGWWWKRFANRLEIWMNEKQRLWIRFGFRFTFVSMIGQFAHRNDGKRWIGGGGRMRGGFFVVFFVVFDDTIVNSLR